MTTVVKPDFSVAADETPYRRLGAVIREEVFRYGEACYRLGIQVHAGLINPEQYRAALNEQRGRIGSKLESLLIVIDVITEMRDAEIDKDLRPTRRRKKAPVVAEIEPVMDPDAQELIDRVMSGRTT